MSSFKQLSTERRSCRDFKTTEIAPEHIETLFQSAFFAPSSKGRQGWDIIAVDNKADIEKLSEAKEHYISFIANAPLVVVLCGDKSVNDCWIEDASIVGFKLETDIFQTTPHAKRLCEAFSIFLPINRCLPSLHLAIPTKPMRHIMPTKLNGKRFILVSGKKITTI